MGIVNLQIANLADAPALVLAMEGAIIGNFEMLRKGTPTIEQETAYLQRMESEKSIIFLVLASDDRIIGTCGLHEVDNFNQTARVGMVIFQQSDRGQHYGTNALQQLIAIAFSRYKLEKLYANVIATNTVQIERDKKLGFKQEGYLAKHYLLNGIRHDMVQLALLKTDWLNSQK